MKTFLLGLFVAAALLQLGLTIYNRHDPNARLEIEHSANDGPDSIQPMARLNPSSVPRLTHSPASPPTKVQAGMTPDEPARNGTGGANKGRSEEEFLNETVQTGMTPDEPAKNGTGGANRGRSEEEFLNELEVAFTTDNPPNDTSAKRSAAIIQGFGSPLAKGAHLNSVDCRATRCKIEIDFADKSADAHVISELFTILRSVDVDVDHLGYQVAKREVSPDGRIYVTVHLFDVTSPQPVL